MGFLHQDDENQSARRQQAIIEIQLNNVIESIYYVDKRQMLFDLGMNNAKEFITWNNKTELK
jgi:hypothetical protein